jgi:hypothetical protein
MGFTDDRPTHHKAGEAAGEAVNDPFAQARSDFHAARFSPTDATKQATEIRFNDNDRAEALAVRLSAKDNHGPLTYSFNDSVDPQLRKAIDAQNGERFPAMPYDTSWGSHTNSSTSEFSLGGKAGHSVADKMSALCASLEKMIQSNRPS